jgi:hypothetical protein
MKWSEHHDAKIAIGLVAAVVATAGDTVRYCRTRATVSELLRFHI